MILYSRKTKTERIFGESKTHFEKLIILHAIKEAKEKTGYDKIYPIEGKEFEQCFDIDNGKSSDAIILDFLKEELC